MRLINFSIELGCSQWPPVFLPSLPYQVKRFFTRFPFFSSTFLYSAELASKEGGNCNNITLGAGAESSQSGSYVMTIIQTSPWSAWPSPQRLTQPGSHLKPWFLFILHTRPPTKLLTVYAVGRYFRLWELSVLCLLVKEMRLSFLKRHWMAWSLSGRLDATEFAPPLCKRQPR